MATVLPMRFSIPPSSVPVADLYATYYGEDCEKPADMVQAVACRNLDGSLLDLERLLFRAPTKDAAVDLLLLIAAYVDRVVALQDKAGHAVESFDFKGSAA